MLIQLPNGDWIDPAGIKKVVAFDTTDCFHGGYVGPRVVVNDAVCVEVATFEAACQLRDKLACLHNKEGCGEAE